MIHLSIPSLPPSVNDVYMTISKMKGGRRITLRPLTAEGRKYKKETLAHLVKKHQPQLLQMKPDTPYVLFVRLTMPVLVNKGWAKRTSARYKRYDVSNHIKTLEDCLVDASGVDDTNFLIVAGEKVQGDVERSDVYIWNLDAEESPFYETTIRI